MILVVAGPRISKLDRLMAKIVTIGVRTLYRFSLARKPRKPPTLAEEAPKDDDDDDELVAG